MIKYLLLFLTVVIITYIYNDKSKVPTAPIVSSDAVKVTNAEQVFERAYSYEFYIGEKSISGAPELSAITPPKQKTVVEQQFLHQPTQFEGTDKITDSVSQLPPEVLPGIEFIKSDDKLYFKEGNEGKYISVIPEQKPLLVRKE